MISIEVEGIGRTKRKLEGVIQRIKHLGPQLEIEAARWQAEVDQSFAAAISPDGIKWAPLDPQTLAQNFRRRKGFGVPLSSAHGAVTVRLKIDRSKGPALVFGVPSDRWYLLRFQHFGAPGGNIPARPFLPFRGSFKRPILQGGRVVDLVRMMVSRIEKFIVEGRAR
jgi:phage gpG-like protein